MPWEKATVPDRTTLAGNGGNLLARSMNVVMLSRRNRVPWYFSRSSGSATFTATMVSCSPPRLARWSSPQGELPDRGSAEDTR
jgi:hypothetical protein